MAHCLHSLLTIALSRMPCALKLLLIATIKRSVPQLCLPAISALLSQMPGNVLLLLAARSIICKALRCGVPTLYLSTRARTVIPSVLLVLQLCKTALCVLHFHRLQLGNAS